VLRKLLISMVVSLSVATVNVVIRGTPTMGIPDVTPRIVSADRPSVVTITLRIPDSKFTASSVDLTRVDERGDVLPQVEMKDEEGTNNDAVPGHQFFLVLRDDGTKGDLVAHDRVYTRRVTMKEPAGPVYFQVRASFKDVERPLRSAPFAVDVRR
jgi:hypothetical protein